MQNDDFMDFMGFRNVLVEDQIDECLSSPSPEDSLSEIDTSDFTSEELDYIRNEVERRQ